MSGGNGPIPPAFECSEVSVMAGRRPVLRGITFSLPAGTRAAVIGPNGAGKTTLLGLCNGLTLPRAGVVRTFGREVTARSAPDLRKNIGYVAQWRAVDPRVPITVYESVLCGTYGKVGLLRKPGPAEHAAAAEALDAVGSAHLAKRPLGRLSGGEAQRVAIARALAQKPPLLLLDEPTASLDWHARRDILRLIADLRRSLSLTVIMATHELNSLSELFDTALLLKEGRLLACCAVEQALQPELLSRLYDTPVSVLRDGNKLVVPL